MNQPQRRQESRFIHIDASSNKYTVHFGLNNLTGRDKLTTSAHYHIPIQDYNNVNKIELVTFKLNNGVTLDTEYIMLEIKNIDGKVDSTTSCQNATTVCYLDGTKPIYFTDRIFEFYPSISKLSKLDIELKDNSGNLIPLESLEHSFLLKITYTEGNFY